MPKRILFVTATIATAAMVFYFFQARRERPYNLVFITIDTLRADRLGCYGHDPISPNIDRLAIQGVLCRSVYAQAPLTFPSHASIFTGTDPDFHGVRDNNWYRLPAIPTMASILQSYGYRTAAVVSSSTVSGDKGLNRGFDFYSDVPYLKYAETEAGCVPERKAGDSVPLAIEQLLRFRETPDRPFFLWLHLFDPHAQYSPPAPFCEKFAHDLYDGEIAYADSCLGRLFAALDEDTLVVITADHGEGLGDHGEQSHGYFLYSSTLRVPLIFHCPAKISPARLETPWRSIDIMPTTLSLLGIENHGVSQGTDLSASVLQGKPHSTPPIYAETYFPHHAFGWRILRSITVDDYKYVDTRRGELYFLPEDPHELQNLIALRPQDAATYMQILRARLEKSRHTQPGVLEREGPQAVGYFSYPGSDGFEPERPFHELPDPPEMVEVIEMFTQAQSLLWQGEDERALQLLRSVLEKDPANATCWALAGKICTRINRLDEAEEAFRRFYFDLRPHLKIARNGLVDVLIQRQKYREAEKIAAQIFHFGLDHVHREDLDAHKISPYLESEFRKRGKPLSKSATVAVCEKGVKWSLQDGEIKYAIAAGEGTLNVFLLEIDEKDEMLLSLLACLKLEQRDFAQAVHWAQKAALSADPPPGACFYLGRALQERGELNQATSAFQKALKLRPQWPAALYWSGLCYWQLGDVASAADTWEKIAGTNDPVALFYRGMALTEQMRYGEAVTELQKAAARPNWPEAVYHHGLCLWRLGSQPGNGRVMAEAEAVWDGLNEMPDHPDVWLYRGKALQERRKFPQAIQAFREAIQRRPDWPEAFYLYGLCHWQMGNTTSARHLWNQILPKLKPGDPFIDKILEMSE